MPLPCTVTSVLALRARIDLTGWSQAPSGRLPTNALHVMGAGVQAGAEQLRADAVAAAAAGRDQNRGEDRGRGRRAPRHAAHQHPGAASPHGFV